MPHEGTVSSVDISRDCHARLPPDHARGCTTGVPPVDPQPEAQGVSSRCEREGQVAASCLGLCPPAMGLLLRGLQTS